MSDKFYFSLDKDDSKIIKGVAILLIVMHNYIHSIIVDFSENEMVFSLANTLGFINNVLAHPSFFIQNILVYFGHYGVQLFVFISAYGLSKKYKEGLKENYFKYLFNRLVKIYGLIIVGLLFLIFFLFNKYSTDQFLDIIVHFLIPTLNWNEEFMFRYVGVWWFFRFIIQLYVIFPLLLYIILSFGKKGTIYLLLVSYISIYVLTYFTDTTSHFIYGNAIGHLPEFILGIYLALYQVPKINAKVFIVAGCLFIGGCFFEVLFPFTFISATILLLYLINPILKISKERLGVRALMFIGEISMIMFVTNGVIRYRTLIWTFGYAGTDSIDRLICILLHLLLVILISYVIYLIYSYVSKVIKKHTGISLL